MFAVITPALIPGAFAERMKFSAYLAFTLLWATFVYDPVAHWVWGGGLDQEPRRARFRGRPGRAHHLGDRRAPLRPRDGQAPRDRQRGHAPAQPDHDGDRDRVCSGSAGSGSTPAAPSRPAALGRRARSSTRTPPPPPRRSSWSLIEWLHKGKATVLGACTGAVAGLVADHARRRVRHAAGRDGDRPARLHRLLRGDHAQGQVRLRRLARRLRRPRGRGHLRRVADRRVREPRR